MMRTHMCGELRSSHIGQQVTVCGWVARRREHGEHLAFVDLRDHTGVVQCVVDHAHDLRSEYVLRVTGTVRQRPEGTANDALDTGEVEMGDCEVEVLNTAEPPPFPLDARTQQADESVRLRYRFVDLRTERMQRNMRVRARVNSAIRRSMERQGFVEVETPLLVAPTPEGARDFVVPARLRQGSFFTLPQSPQLYKQLSIVGGIDRYYQIARCARDEDLRADRQFEFTQLDAEATFVTKEDVHDFIGDCVLEAIEEITGTRPSIGRMTWIDAMERYGSDKPDVRFGLELVELTDVFADTTANVFKAPCVKGLRLPRGADELGRNKLDQLTDVVKTWGAKGLAWVKVAAGGAFEGGVSKLLSDNERTAVIKAMDATAGDLLFFVADERTKARHYLGLLRLHLHPLPVNEGFELLWLVDFPLFEDVDDAGRPIPAHHLFTMPHPDDLDLLETDPLRVRSQSYDLVLNGWELGSGSIRIHQPEIQQRVFSAVGIGPEDAEARFGFLLEAFRYGAPPHGGFAFGIDRLAAILAGEENIREVIAFPKTQSGVELMTGAPSPIDAGELAELGIRTLPPKQ